jgi:hypothetical protein
LAAARTAGQQIGLRVAVVALKIGRANRNYDVLHLGEPVEVLEKLQSGFV